MVFWWKNNCRLVTLILSFLLYWLFGDIIFFLVLLLFIGLIFLLRGLYRATFIYLEVIFISAYLLTCLICMLFVFTATFKIFLMIVGLWFILSLYERKRF
ncbi:MAG TPA: hypothetical protein GX390_00095 [Acholeplasmataceae bacterium]|jgi:hypothetical protein|nr:hypothetical protein [Acholeplasmataceae bacterium]